jgi:hypothetical protein
MTVHVNNDAFQLNEEEKVKSVEELNEKRTQTASVLTEMFYDFLRVHKLNPSDYKLDFFVMQNVSARYIRDVKRIHENHKDIPLIDRHKIAGYLTYWICKLKPISVALNSVHIKNTVTPFYVNELFALYISLGRIEAHFEAFSSDRAIMVYEEFVEPFLYSLKFRPITGDNLSMDYYLLENQKEAV